MDLGGGKEAADHSGGSDFVGEDLALGGDALLLVKTIDIRSYRLERENMRVAASRSKAIEPPSSTKGDERQPGLGLEFASAFEWAIRRSLHKIKSASKDTGIR